MKLLNRSLYDVKAMMSFAGGFVGIAILERLLMGNGFACVTLIALMALFRNRVEKMFYWILMLLALMMANANIIPKSISFYVAQRVMMVLFAIVLMSTIFGRRSPPALAPMVTMMLYSVYMIVPSMLGWMPLISVLKLFLFSMVYLAYFGVANKVMTSPRVSSRVVRGMFLGVASLYVVGSLFLIPFPALSQVSQEEYVKMLQSGADVVSLFTGLSVHSQCLGPLVATISTLLYADMAFNLRKFDKFYVLLMALCPILLVRSSSRAGMLAYLVGHLTVTWLLFQARQVRGQWRGKIIGAVLSILTVLALAVLFVPKYRDAMTRFAMKTSAEETRAADFSMERAMSSRQGLMDDALSNFKKSPMIGNGFQVSASMQGMRDVPLVRLLSAPVEKGVWVTAVLEEGGVLGALLLLIFIINATVGMMRHRAYSGLSIFAALLAANMGEFTMFSMSALGGFLWGMVFVGIALDGTCSREARSMRDAAQRTPVWVGWGR